MRTPARILHCLVCAWERYQQDRLRALNKHYKQALGTVDLGGFS